MSGRRWEVVLGVACAVALVVAATAAARGGVDRSFGVNGVAYLDSLAPFGAIAAVQSGPERGIYVLTTSTRCGATACSRDFDLLRLNPDGSRDSDFGVVPVARGASPYMGDPELAVDAEGRALVALAVPGNVTLTRVAPEGRIDESFGQGGTTTLSCGCEAASTLVEFDREGRILVVIGHQEWFKSAPRGGYWLTGVEVLRLLPSGQQDPLFGPVRMASKSRKIPYQALVQRDGSLVLAGSDDSSAALYLMRIGRGGTIDRKYGRKSRQALMRLRLGSVGSFLDSPRLHALARLRRGGANVLVGKGRRSFVLRLLPSGGIDPNFARDGVRRLRWRIDDAAVTGAGRVFIFGRRGGGWKPLVSLLDARGMLDRAFNGGRPLTLSGWYRPSLAMQGRRLLLYGNDGEAGCRSACPSMPKLMRLSAPRYGKDRRRGA